MVSPDQPVKTASSEALQELPNLSSGLSLIGLETSNVQLKACIRNCWHGECGHLSGTERFDERVALW